MNTYLITATDPDDLENDYTLMVRAPDPMKAVRIWQQYYNFGWDEDTEIGLFRGGPISPDTPKIALHPRYTDMARIWHLPNNLSALPEGLVRWGLDLPLVGYVEP